MLYHLVMGSVYVRKVVSPVRYSWRFWLGLVGASISHSLTAEQISLELV